ncbi:MAG: leucine-rich repeat protein, partial [archaeon]|nr:leucine-rich repeat protein [archaeon]
MLTNDIILKKYPYLKDYSELKSLNLWGNNLSDISLISQFKNLEIVSLSVNNISTLSPFSSLINLKELYLRKNNISSLSEIDHLIPLKNLKILWLEDNPICKENKYVSYVIEKLPQLLKFDNKPVKKDINFSPVLFSKYNEELRKRLKINFSKADLSQIKKNFNIVKSNHLQPNTSTKEVIRKENISKEEDTIKEEKIINHFKKLDFPVKTLESSLGSFPKIKINLNTESNLYPKKKKYVLKKDQIIKNYKNNEETSARENTKEVLIYKREKSEEKQNIIYGKSLFKKKFPKDSKKDIDQRHLRKSNTILNFRKEKEDDSVKLKEM